MAARRLRGRLALLATATSFLLCVPQLGGSSSARVADSRGAVAAAVAGRPNIVFLMVDDMRRDELRFMPRTRAWLEDGGVRFANAIMPNPLCCPTRASVLTGRHAHNHGVWSHVAPFGFHAFDDRSTLPVWLRSAGYVTTYLGKYLNGYGLQPPPRSTSGGSTQYVPPGWSTWLGSIDGGLRKSHAQRGSTYNYFDTTLNNNGHGYIGNDGRYQTDVYGRMAAASLSELAASDAPFFSYVSFTAPHNGGPAEPNDPGLVWNTWSHTMERMGTPARPRRVYGMFDGTLTTAPGRNWYAEEPTGLHGGYDGRRPISDDEWRHIRNAARQRAEALWVVDEAVDRIMRALQYTGELGRTMVVFTSDNGYFLGERRVRQGKSWPFGPSGRVPLLIRGPGIPAGEVRRDPYLSVDHAATLADLAGVTIPYTTDGISMLRVARRGDRGWDRPVLTESAPPAGGTEPAILGIRTRKYFYARWDNGEEELFDLATDFAERHNLETDPRYGEVLSRLREVLADVRDCKGAACNPPLEPGLG